MGPGGVYAFPQTPQALYLLPFIEEEGIWNQLDLKTAETVGIGDANLELMVLQPTIFLCPSDSTGLEHGFFHPAIPNQRFSSSNYSPVEGETQADALMGRPTAPAFTASRAAVFGVNRKTRFKDITDGTSSTMAYAECVIGMRRGLLFGDTSAAYNTVYTRTTPNSNVPDRTYAGICNLPAEKHWPCESPNDGDHFDKYAASRSQHPGIVHVLLCDGSARAVQDEIDVTIWRNLGFIADGNLLQGEF
jgi:hypothetical protein